MFLLSDYSTIRFLFYYNYIFLLYASNSFIYLGWEPHKFRCPVLAFPLGIFWKNILSFSVLNVSLLLIFNLVCSFVLHCKWINKAKQQPQQQKMVKNMALKTVMHVVLSHNIAWKKLSFVCEKTRHVILKGYPWSLSFPNPLPPARNVSRGNLCLTSICQSQNKKECQNLLAKLRKRFKLNIKFT